MTDGEAREQRIDVDEERARCRAVFEADHVSERKDLDRDGLGAYVDEDVHGWWAEFWAGWWASAARHESAARRAVEACADLLIDRMVKINERRCGGVPREEEHAQLWVLDLMLSRMGFPCGCEFRVRQENGETRVEYPSPMDIRPDA